MDKNSYLNDPNLVVLFLAIMVRRQGGKIWITQEDVDAVAFNRLEEEGFEDGSVEFRLVERKESS